jgi:hypothetical protein
MTNINDKIYKEAVEKSGCSSGLEWWRIHPGEYEKLAEDHPEWYLWGAGHCPSWEQNAGRVDQCAKRMPRAALGYIAKLLTPKRLGWCAVREPGQALFSAAKWLTSEHLDWCAEQMPRTALSYASSLLTPARLDWCKKRQMT